jgi:pimeloyl-ACP methyl ester carboxylesterase
LKGTLGYRNASGRSAEQPEEMVSDEKGTKFAPMYPTSKVRLSRYQVLGTAVLKGFADDKESYVDWIVEQLEKKGSPVDLFGHDWGCMFALRVASLRPDLIRTVAGGNGPISKRHEWHRLAKTWQTAGEGEKFMSELSPKSFSGILQSLGLREDAAASSALRVDDLAKDSILKLYRSAVHVGDEWQSGLESVRCPALLFWGNEDNECPVRFAYEMAQRIPACRVVELECGHWVPLEKPDKLAAFFKEHWKSGV